MFNFVNKHIRVTFINDVTGEIFGLSNMNPDQLPEGFDKPTTFTLHEKEWQVVKAEPVLAVDFTKSKGLTLHLRVVEQIDPRNIKFSIPTITNELPDMVDTKLFDDFTLELHEDYWRQIEFFPLNLLPIIQKEMEKVESILFPDNESPSSSGYDNVHVRRIIRQNLTIPFAEFCEVIGIQSRGTLIFQGYQGFVKDSFAVRSANHVFYGTVKNGTIKELCLEKLEFVDDELSNIAERFGLVLVNWCRGQITTV